MMVGAIIFGAAAGGVAGYLVAQPQPYTMVRGNEDTVFRMNNRTGMVEACTWTDREFGCYAMPPKSTSAAGLTPPPE